MTKQELLNECEMLKGNINRIMVTKDPGELIDQYDYARERLTKIFTAKCRTVVEALQEQLFDKQVRNLDK